MTSSQNKEKSPRIIMLLSSLPPMQMGGAEVQALRLYSQLRAQGVDVKIITWGKIWHPKKGQVNGIEFTRVRSLLNLIADIPSLFKTKKATAPTRIDYTGSEDSANTMSSKIWAGMILRFQLVYFTWLLYLFFRRSSFDILHVHTMEWPAIAGVRIGKMLKKPVVIKDSTMNGLQNLLRYPAGEKKQAKIVGYANFVAMTRMIRTNFLKAGVDDKKISMIPNGINITPRPAKKEIWIDKAVFVGNLTQQPAKGIDILLSAWKQVTREVPSASLEIVGEGDLDAYRKYTKGLGIASSVQFLGKQRDTISILLAADVFVLPSRREGMSNALMEAMLCAMPVVVTDVSGSQDLVEDGVSGIIVPPADAPALAKAIISMFKDREGAIGMGQKAYSSVAEKCNMSTVGASYENLYRQIHYSRL